MNRTRIAIAGLALLAAACTGGNTPGTPTPGTPTPNTPTSASGNASDDGNLATVKPCELISTTDVASLGIPDTPESSTLAGAATCEWIGPDGGLTVSVDPKKGADKLNYGSATKTPGKYGKFEGFKVPAPQNTKYMCHVVLSTGSSSNVTLVASVGAATTDTDKACALADKSAELVANKLP